MASRPDPTATVTAFDPFTLEIVKQRLRVIAEEMFLAQGRSSKSPIIYEVLDYACAITDAKAHLVAQANGVAGFLGALTFAVDDVLAKFGLDGLEPGDVVATNIPYQGGSSPLSDVTTVMPLFFEGEIRAFAVNKAHWTEIGGKDPGSMTNDSVDIFQEGVQLPCIKLFERGRPVAALIDILEANVRTPRQHPRRPLRPGSGPAHRAAPPQRTVPRRRRGSGRPGHQRHLRRG